MKLVKYPVDVFPFVACEQETRFEMLRTGSAVFLKVVAENSDVAQFWEDLSVPNFQFNAEEPDNFLAEHLHEALQGGQWESIRINLPDYVAPWRRTKLRFKSAPKAATVTGEAFVDPEKPSPIMPASA